MTTFAIIETGGKQYQVSPDQTVRIEKLKGEKGEAISFDKVLLVADGEAVKVGKPFVAGATVSAQVLSQAKGKKIRVFKYKAKSKYRRTSGHRQLYTEVLIKNIYS